MVGLNLITELHSQNHNVYIIIVMGIPFFQWDTLLNLNSMQKCWFSSRILAYQAVQIPVIRTCLNPILCIVLLLPKAEQPSHVV